jgi:hypothetical protein
MTTARGKYAFGFCDKTGFRYPLHDLVDEYVNGVKTGLRVGRDVVDPDHPQNFTGRVRVDDPQSLMNPRPENKSEPVDFRFPAFDLATLETITVPFLHADAGVLTTSDTTTVAPINVEITGIAAISAAGTITVQADVSITPTGVSATMSAGTLSVGAITTYTVTVASSGYGNKYYIAGLSGAAPTLTLNEGSTYRFDQSDNTNSGHPLRFSTTSNGTHAGGSEYTTGVTTNGTPGSSGAYTQITVASSAPTLYYYCTNHSGMGGTANTP